MAYSLYVNHPARIRPWPAYPTFWVNRLGLPPEQLGVLPDAAGPDLNALLHFVD